MRRYIITLLILFSVAIATPIDSKIQFEIKDTLKNRLNSPYQELLISLYKSYNYNPIWIGDKNSNRFALLMRLLDSPFYNYKNKDFNRKNIKYLSFSLDNGDITGDDRLKAIARLDVLLSDAMLQLIHFVLIGDVNWALVKSKIKSLKEDYDINSVWEIKPKKMPTLKDIQYIINTNSLALFLKKNTPFKRRYLNLISMLHKYNKMPNFKRLHEGRVIRVGKSDERIPQIKRMLKFFGDYPLYAPINSYFGEDLAKAVISFRRRFRLPISRSIDNIVIRYLNIPKWKYIKKILVNLDKTKLYPPEFENEYIEINIPEFKMRLFRDNQEVFESDVVVGRIDRPTPIFSSKMRYMVLNPSWIIPDNLIKRDLIPALHKNPNYLKSHDIHIFKSCKDYKAKGVELNLSLDEIFKFANSSEPIPYCFVQYPSDRNALGRVKFMFPNRYSVYLHDTDNKRLFGYQYRVFSSGCMRVKKPFQLLYFLLPYANKSYTKDDIDAILNMNETTKIELKEPLPVHILYFTATRENNRDLFFYDIYMYDEIIWESTFGHIQPTFKLPKERLKFIKHSKAKKRKSHIF